MSSLKHSISYSKKALLLTLTSKCRKIWISRLAGVANLWRGAGRNLIRMLRKSRAVVSYFGCDSHTLLHYREPTMEELHVTLSKLKWGKNTYTTKVCGITIIIIYKLINKNIIMNLGFTTFFLAWFLNVSRAGGWPYVI